MLFNWFKKKDKLIPLEPVNPSPKQAKPSKPLALGAHAKPAGRPDSIQKSTPINPRSTPPGDAKATTQTKTSDSVVIRIGKLGEVLLQYDMISRENLEKALALQQKSFVSSGPQDKAVQKRKLLGEILVENNFVTEEQLLSAFARHCRIPYIKLNKYGLPKEAIKSVPVDLIIKHKVMPVDKIGSMLMLAVTDPYDTAAVEEVAAKTGLKVKSILCKPSEFAEMVKFYYPDHCSEKSAETPVDITPEAAPKTSPADIPAKLAPTQEPEETASSEPRLGEETAVFKIEEISFPEPPAVQPAPVSQKIEDPVGGQEQAEKQLAETPAENIKEEPVAQTTSTTEVTEKLPETPPKELLIEPATSVTAPDSAILPTEATPAPEDKKELFLGGDIEDHMVTVRPLDETSPRSASSDHYSVLPDRQAGVAKPEMPTEPTPEVSPQPLQAQEPENPTPQPPETSEINGYDTSIINIHDLIASQKDGSDESIEIAPEEPEPIDVAPYVYPTSNASAELPQNETSPDNNFAGKIKEPEEISESLPKTPPETTQPARATVHADKESTKNKEITSPTADIPAKATKEEKPTVKDKKNVQPAEEKPQSAPIPIRFHDDMKAGREIFKENPIWVSEDEFQVARQLFTTQLTPSWEKLYHRSKPSTAEKVDEGEFAFCTESAIK